MELTPLQERALLAALREEFAHWNRARFRGALRPPVFTLDDTAQRLGQWQPHTRTLSLSRALVRDRAWPVVIEVLKHEMAHQYVSEVLGVHDEPPHGPSFARVCKERGIDARAAGTVVEPALDARAERMVRTVHKLLALAGSANEHEAEAAMRTARRLMAQHHLSALEHAPSAEPVHDHLHVGAPLLRVHEWQRLLASLLSEHFHVEAIWVPAYLPSAQRRASLLELCGTHANLKIAEYVHGFLTSAAPRLWLAHKERSGERGERGRLAYFAGLIDGFREQLRREPTVPASADVPAGERSTALLRVADRALAEYLRQRHPYVRSVRYGGSPRSESFAHGKSDGRALTLLRPLDASPSAAPKRLPPKS